MLIWAIFNAPHMELLQKKKKNLQKDFVRYILKQLKSLSKNRNFYSFFKCKENPNQM